jgi:hypothetical protein
MTTPVFTFHFQKLPVELQLEIMYKLDKNSLTNLIKSNKTSRDIFKANYSNFSRRHKYTTCNVYYFDWTNKCKMAYIQAWNKSYDFIEEIYNLDIFYKDFIQFINKHKESIIPININSSRQIKRGDILQVRLDGCGTLILYYTGTNFIKNDDSNINIPREFKMFKIFHLDTLLD